MRNLVWIGIFICSFFFTNNALSQFQIKSKQLEANIIQIEELFYSNPDSAVEIASKSLKISQIYGDKVKIAEFAINLGILHVEKNMFDKASNYYKIAMIAAKESNDTILLARVYGNMGNLFMYLGDNKSAIEYFDKASNLFETLNFESGMAVASGAIGNLYFMQKDYKKADWYYQKALEKYSISDDSLGIAMTYLDLGSVKKINKAYDTAINYFLQASQIFLNMNMLRYIGQSYANIGNVYTEINQPSDARLNLDSALFYFEKSQNIEDILRCRLDITELALSQNNYAVALENLSILEKALDTIQNSELLRKYYEKSYNYYKKVGSTEMSLQYHEKLFQITDSITESEKQARIDELSARYDLNRKEYDILVLNQTNEINRLELSKKNTLIFLLSGIYIMISIILVVLILFIRQRAKATKAELQQKLREKILAAYIEAEDKERAKLASELHDGLGPLLSTAKLFTGQIIRNKNIDPDSKELAESATAIIDESISTTRQISHNLSPIVLKQIGLKNSIVKILNSIKKASKVKTIAHIDDFETDEITQRYILRIVQELLNNTIKYADAQTINISIKSERDYICLLYSDDGNGFDHESVYRQNKASSGIINIKSRAAELGGKADFQSEKGNGMKVNIVFPLNK